MTDWFSWFTLDPQRVPLQTAGAAGSLVALVVTRKYAALQALILFGVGQVTTFYFTIPFCDAMGWSATFYPPVAFTIGVVGMAFWAAMTTLGQNLMDDPRGTLTWAWRTWKGDPQ